MTESDPSGSRGKLPGGGGERESGAKSVDPGGGSREPDREHGQAGGAERKARRRSGRRRRRRSGEARPAGAPAAEPSRGARGERATVGRDEPGARRPRRRNLLGTWLLVLSLIGLAVAAIFIFLPFLSTLIAAVLITTVAYPLFTNVLSFVGSERRGLASGITCLLVVLLVVLPALLCGLMVAKEVHEWVEERRSAPSETRAEGTSAGGAVGERPAEGGSAGDQGEAAPAWWMQLYAAGAAELDRQVSQLRSDLRALSSPPDSAGASSPAGSSAEGAPDPLDEQGRLEGKPAFSISANAIANVARWATRVFGLLLAGVVGVVVKCLLMLFIMFYFFKDGPRILGSVQQALAVDPAYQEKMVEKFRVVSVGMLRGILATALTQGVVAGIGSAFLGLKPFLFGTLVALCALVPVAGTGLVTVPMTIYFLVNAQYGHAAAAAAVAVLTSSLDNILRPLFVEGDLKLHPVWILLSILGGVGCFGVLGLILGPMVVVLLRTVLEFVAEESRTRALERS